MQRCGSWSHDRSLFHVLYNIRYPERPWYGFLNNRDVLYTFIDIDIKIYVSSSDCFPFFPFFCLIANAEVYLNLARDIASKRSKQLDLVKIVEQVIVLWLLIIHFRNLFQSNSVPIYRIVCLFVKQNQKVSAIYYSGTSQLSKAIECFTKTIEAAKTIGDLRMMEECVIYLGTCHFLKGDIKQVSLILFLATISASIYRYG